VNKDIYLAVEYYDIGTGWVELEYDSNISTHAVSGVYTPAISVFNTRLKNRNNFQTCVLYLPQGKFSNRQNDNADFRFSAKTNISKIELCFDKPEEYIKQENTMNESEPIIKFGDKKMKIVFEGFDANTKEETASLLNKTLPMFKSIGMTSHMLYVKWNVIEHEKGQFDFSYYDSAVELYETYGVNWFPFIVIGSPYTLPDWF
jgi:hypothetical protein